MKVSTSSRLHVRAIFILSALVITLPLSAMAQSWPADGEWVPATVNGIPASDPCNDTMFAEGGDDVVGDPMHPAYYFKLNRDLMYFRMRVDAHPASTLLPYNWGILVDVARERTDYEYTFTSTYPFVGAGVQQFTNLIVDAANRVDDPPDQPPVPSLPGMMVRFVFADTTQLYPSCDPVEDFFVDMAIPTEALFVVPEWYDEAAPLRFVAGTSSDGLTINADAASWALAAPPSFFETESDPVCFDFDGDGYDNCRDNCIDIPNPEQADFDLDGQGDDCDGDDDNDDDPDTTDCQPLNADVHNGAAEKCNNVDDNCVDGIDEGLGHEIYCGTGACAAEGYSNCFGGVLVELCIPGEPTGDDTDCDGVDDDCDGDADEGYVSYQTFCGIGACASTGASSCMNGVESTNCTGGEQTGDDSDCDNVDDDCDGDADESYAPHVTFCGTGACASTGESYCENGSEYSTCKMNPPDSYYDYDCDGVDDNCNGHIDEEYVGHTTECGVGACAATGTSSCVEGKESQNCTALGPTGDDTDCDGVDDDCDGVADEAYVSHVTYCGTGACASTGESDCETGDEESNCVAGEPTGDDTDCDNVDDDCDGTADDGWIETETTCGEGVCEGSGLLTCVEGQQVDTCEPNGGGQADDDCDNFDDDCDGTPDDEFDGTVTHCGIGACAVTGQTWCSEGSILDNCIPGEPAGSDTTCNDIDEDCNGTADEDYVPVATECGEGACASTGMTSCVEGAVQDSCKTENGETEECNGADDDCDGTVDDGFVNTDGDDLADCIDPDDDNDGDLDDDDNCPLVYNPEQEDADRNGVGDACEGDADGDGITDANDNCPTVANEDQEDLNDDDEGDACDCDIDGDQVMNQNPGCQIPEGTEPDNCPMVQNTDQEDLNDDDTGDACQTFTISHTGGCSAGGAGDRGGLVALIVALIGLTLLFGSARRRARAIAGALAFLTVFGAASAIAQTAIPVQTFEPSPFKQDLFTAGKGYTLGQWNWDVGVMFDYQNSPLVLRYDDDVVKRIVEHQATAHVFGAIGFTNWLDLGVVLPVIMYQGGTAAPGMAAPGIAGVGDLRIVPRVRLYRTPNKIFAIGITPEFTAPTGTQIDPYMGSASWTFAPWLNLSVDMPRFGFVFDFGYRLVKDSNWLDIAVDDQIRMKFGFWVGLVPQKLDLIGELMVSTSISKPFDLQATPIEPIGGLRWHAHPCVDVNVGGGASVTEGVAGPRFRVFAGVTYGCDRCGMDDDGDGIGNCADTCRNTAEDVDDFEDADGCPDADDDGDKVCDPWVAEKGLQADYPDCAGADQCPREAGPAWNNGCPGPDGDADNDGVCDPWVTEKDAMADYDGVCKGVDKCPDVKGPAWNQGCPPPNPDLDGDGVCDPWVTEKAVGGEFAGVCAGSDKCPDVAEDKDGDADDDGCPEERAKVEGKKIVIMEAVYFVVNKDVIIDESFPVLEEVAKILRENPQIKLVRIEAHTDSDGNDAYNMKLSIARAKAVVKYLTDKAGIDAKRLEWKGLGETKPIVKPEKTSADKQKNRRVEFVIVEQGDAG